MDTPQDVERGGKGDAGVGLIYEYGYSWGRDIAWHSYWQGTRWEADEIRRSGNTGCVTDLGKQHRNKKSTGVRYWTREAIEPKDDKRAILLTVPWL